MYSTTKIATPALIVYFISVFLASCGGGGGGDNEGSDGQQTNNQVNPGLTGYLFPEDDGEGVYLINASTGLATHIPNTDWENQDEVFPLGIVQFAKTPLISSHDRFVVNANRCRSYTLAVNISCILVQDLQGNYLSEFDVLYDVWGPVRLSFDGQYFAFFRTFSIHDESLEIYNLNGDLISGDNSLTSRSFQWLPDGSNRIVYPKDGRRFYFTKPLSTDEDYYLILPDELVGDIYDFDISPEGTQIVFTLATEVTQFSSVQAKAYLMNIDGSNIRLLADVPEGESGYISDPTWSPDGNWILLKEGYSAGQDDTVPGTSGYLYIVPSEDQGGAYTLSIVDAERSSGAKMFKYDISLGSDSSPSYASTAIPGVSFVWLP
jgi:hypothetical protein